MAYLLSTAGVQLALLLATVAMAQGSSSGSCRNSPCLNGGTCVTVGDEFYCLCTLGFVGDTCIRAEDCENTEACRDRCMFNWCEEVPGSICETDPCVCRARYYVGRQEVRCPYQGAPHELEPSGVERGGSQLVSHGIFGNNVTLRSQRLKEYDVASYIDNETVLPPGRMRNFSLYVNELNIDDVTETGIRLQIWRPRSPLWETHLPDFTLIWEVKVTVTLGQTGGALYTFDLDEQASLNLNGGERIGWTYERFGVISYDYNSSHVTFERVVMADAGLPYGDRTYTFRESRKVYSVAVGVDVDVCLSNPCQNGGTCYPEGSGIRCACQAGSVGSTCQYPIYGCKSAPCQNGGHCIAVDEYVSCDCPSGYFGTFCESAIGCQAAPCLNGGYCLAASNGSSYCLCHHGYSGPYCATDDIYCSTSPCQNGGTCLNRAEYGNYCVCPPRFTGETCETDAVLSKSPGM